MLSLNELAYCAKYPFSGASKEFVTLLNSDLNSLDINVIKRAKDRVLIGVDKGEVPVEAASKDPKTLTREILAYPVAKILVSLTRDPYIAKRYALAEARAFSSFLQMDQEVAVLELARDFGYNVDSNMSLPFVEYLRTVPQTETLRLVNAPIHGGRVQVDRECLAELLAERFKKNVEDAVAKPYEVPDMFTVFAEEIKAEAKRTFTSGPGGRYSGASLDKDFGPINIEAFPPCLVAIAAELRAGVGVAHSPRFVMSTFLINIGMPTEAIIDYFRNAPNFNEQKTRYYIQYSSGEKGSGTKYTTPGCDKLITMGLCKGKDRLCETIKNPLGYYGKKKRFMPSKPISVAGAPAPQQPIATTPQEVVPNG